MAKATGEADLGREVKVRASVMVRQMHMCLDFNGKVWTGNINVDSSVLKEAGTAASEIGEPREGQARKGKVVQKEG